MSSSLHINASALSVSVVCGMGNWMGLDAVPTLAA